MSRYLHTLEKWDFTKITIAKVSIGDETLLKFSGVPLGEACSVVLRGATEQIIGEAERSLHDALCVLTSTVKEPRTLYGGGCSELLMARCENTTK